MSASLSGPVLLVGAGRMGNALLKGWLKNDIGPITLIEPSPSQALFKTIENPDIPGGRVKALLQLDDLNEQFVACVVAIKPQVLKNHAHVLQYIAQSGALMISIAAGTHSSTLKAAWGNSARVIRAMPNTPGSIGYGITGLYADPSATREDRKLANKLLGALGKTIWVDTEDLIDVVTAISGSGPAYLFLVAEALIEAGIEEGLPPDVAEKLARATIMGAGALLRSDKSPAKVLRDAVTSPGGTTAAALDVLLGKLPSLMKEAVHAARTRAEELR